ncbi:MAG: hypothetical protein KAT05_08400 [Spirochaetes bacterium]|nr:hypothetical protein [Spirochaetota bacterium]
MEYKEKYILFIDIIGFTKYIDSTIKDNKTENLKTQNFYNLMSILREDLYLDYEITVLERIN